MPRYFSNQKGFANLIVLVLLLAGLGIGVYLATHPTIFKPRASTSGPISGPTAGPTGLPSSFGKALYLNGEDSHVSTLKTLVTDSNYFTLDLWAYPEMRSDNSKPHRIIVSKTGGKNTLDFSLGLRQTFGKDKLELTFALFTPGPATRNWFIPDAITPKKWQHIAVVANNGTLGIFIDGKKVLNDTYTPFSPGAVLGPSGLVIGSTDFITGAPELNNLYKGYIDELRLSSGTLFSSDFVPLNQPWEVIGGQTQKLFHFDGDLTDALSSTSSNKVTFADSSSIISDIPPAPKPSLASSPGPTFSQIPKPSVSNQVVLFYDFYEGTGASVTDRSKTGNTGTWLGTLGTQWTVGKSGSGANFNGTNNYINIPNSATLRLSGDTTINFWINPASSQQMYSTILSKHSSGNAGYTIEQYANNTNKYYLSWGNSVTFTCNTAADVITLTPNIWQHVTFVKSGNVVTGYVNGNKQYSCNGAFSNIASNGDALTIGRWSAGRSRYWRGQLDDLRIYNYSVYQTQILDDMNGIGTSSATTP